MGGEGGEGETQVRSIIRQINEVNPSHAKKREVVVRADGSKVVRVTKKRRVLMSQQDMKRRSRKHAVIFIAALFLLLFSFAVYFLIKMTAMSGEEYLQSRVEELRKAWGAESVRLTGTGISGTSLSISSVVAEFPADSLVEKVEISEMTADLSVDAFLQDIARGEVLRMKRLNIILRPETVHMKMPQLNGAAIWKFNRMECENFSVSMGRADGIRFALKDSQAHLYYPRSGRDNCVVSLKGGTMLLPNWQTIYVSEAKVHLSPVAVEDAFVAGSVEVPSEDGAEPSSSLVIRGRVANGEKLEKDFSFAAWNMPFSDFTKGRFETFFSARTTARKSERLLSLMTLTEFGPVFHGSFELERIMITSFPAITAMIEHVEPLKRRLYFPPLVESGVVSLEVTGDSIVLTMDEKNVATRDRMAFRGRIEINAQNELSGTLGYGLPGLLTRAEYTDGLPDPIFEDKGDWTWLSTSLSGFANRPEDNMAEIEARAVEARKSRPERLKFDALDVNKLSEQLKADRDAVFPGDIENPNGGGTSTPDADDPFAEPGKASDDPFAPLSPY